MRYELKKSNNKTASSNGKYVARVRHDQTVDIDTFARRIETSCSLTRADIKAALCAFGTELCNSLRNGDKVVLPDIGTFKIEIEATPTDDPENFVMKDHFKRFQLHVIPESKDGVKPLYDQIKLTRAKQD